MFTEPAFSALLYFFPPGLQRLGDSPSNPTRPGRGELLKRLVVHSKPAARYCSSYVLYVGASASPGKGGAAGYFSRASASALYVTEALLVLSRMMTLCGTASADEATTTSMFDVAR